MNYTEAVDWLYTHLPMYQRIGTAAYKEDITNTIKLCNYFDNPQNNFPSIHIAGTNGKGSTSHMLAAVLQESGYKVGLYTSPHLKSFTERIRINGIEINQDFVANFVENNKDLFSSFDPSFFEITVAMAFQYFSSEKVDVAVIETGLGGRLDSTNIITPILSVITNIGWDHQNLLGNTLEKIAFEKAGIIKKNVPVIIGEYQDEIVNVFTKKATAENSTIVFADNVWELEKREELIEGDHILQTFTYKNSSEIVQIQTDQLGIYQEHNCKTALVALEELKKMGFKKIADVSIQSGFKKITELTGLQGRWQILGKNPLVIADTAHNINALRYIVSQLENYNADKLRMIIGFVNDKNMEDILQILPRNAHYYFTQASIPRAMPVEELMNKASMIGLKGDSFTSTSQAFDQAKLEAGKNDLIFIGGSTFVVAELI